MKTLSSIFLLVALIFGLNYMLQFFNPKFQEVDKKVYENPPSYISNEELLLTELRTQYQQSKTQGVKDNIRAVILNEAATIDLNKLKDSSLRRFIENIRRN